MPIDALLGIDVGTSGCRAAISTNTGLLLANHSVPYPNYRPHPRWAEQNAEDYKAAAVVAVRRVLVEADKGARIVFRRICGQSPTRILVDALGSPVRPAIIWQDTRAVVGAEELGRYHLSPLWDPDAPDCVFVYVSTRMGADMLLYVRVYGIYRDMYSPSQSLFPRLAGAGDP